MSARSAAALRLQIEHALERSFPAALTPAQRTIRETASTGIPEVDALLDGGLPDRRHQRNQRAATLPGALPLCFRFLPREPLRAQVCAWVDADDAFDPESAAANGVNLRQLLWVRCRKAGRARPGQAGSQTVDPSRPGSARHRSAAAGRRICRHRARPGRHRSRACAAHPARYVVSLSPGGRQSAHLPRGFGTDRRRSRKYGAGKQRPVQRRPRSSVRGHSPSHCRRNGTARLPLMRCATSGSALLPSAVGRKKPPASVWPAACCLGCRRTFR